MYIPYNPNPNSANVGDCTVRALSKLTHKDWESTYIGLATMGYTMGDMPSSDRVWGEYLRARGFHKAVVPDTCPDCYTIKDFAKDHPTGSYALATGDHVVALVDGDYYDSFNSGSGVPIYFWKKEE